MNKPIYRGSVHAFDQGQLNIIDRAVDRAWEILKQDDHGISSEARKLLSLCVLHEAQVGEDNHIELVNRAVLAFRRKHAQNISERSHA